LHYTTITKYDETFQNVHVIFENDNLVNTLGEVLAANNKNKLELLKQRNIRMLLSFLAEVEKYLSKENQE